MKQYFFGCLVRGMKHKGLVLLAAAFVTLPVWSQDTPNFEVFLGYSHMSFYPQVQGASGRSITLNGGGGSFDWNFMKYMGFKTEFTGYTSTTRTLVIPVGTPFLPAGGVVRAQANMVTYLFGPQAKGHFGVVEPFGQILFGGAHSNFYGDLYHAAGIINRRPDNTAFAMAVGGGLDFRVHKLISIRPIEAEYLMTRFGNAAVINNQNNFRYQAGIVFNLGEKEKPPAVSAGLSLEPTEVMAGEQVKATGIPTNFSPKNTVNYVWNTTGGNVTPNDVTASIDTTGLVAGNYTVQFHASDNKKNSAMASANFTVKEPPKNPPAMSCLADPTTLRSGGPATITCNCKSPDGRTVTVSNWTASGGKIIGNGNTATLDTVGLGAGPVSVSTTCSDDRGLITEANASVNVEVPPPPPTASKACDIDFSSKKAPARIGNEAKACLDGVADSLVQSPNAKAILVGEQLSTEKQKILAAQRAVNAKAYLTSGENQKAIDAVRLEPRTSTVDNNKVEVWIVPEGATFEQPDTIPVDETGVKPQTRKWAAAPATKKSRPPKKSAA